MERLAIEIAVVLLMLGGFALYERHAGAANCVRANVVAEAHQETHNAVVTAVAVQTVTIEKNAYVEAKLVPVSTDIAPAVVCVRKYAAPEALRAADASGQGDHGGRGLPDGTLDAVPATTDISKSAVEVGRNANAQVKQLKDYINNVCLVR
jgi:hypothetical protein